MPTIDERLKAATERAEQASDIAYDFANLPAGSYIDTNSGQIPSLAEWLATKLELTTVAPDPDSLVRRTTTGAIRTADAVNADEAVALGQLQDVLNSVDVNPTANSIARRDASGKVKTANAVDANDAVPLGQLGTAAIMEIATTAQAQALTADDVVITPKKLGDAMNTHVLGMGQTWQDVTGSRNFNVTYTNTTGRPIFVSVICTFPEQSMPVILGLTVQGESISGNAVFNSSGNLGGYYTVQGIVPDGNTYRIDYSGGSFTLHWSELR